MRTGLAEYDGVDHMIAVARALHPDRPGELDNPTWDIGRGWCHPRNSNCVTCPLIGVCPRFIEHGNRCQRDLNLTGRGTDGGALPPRAIWNSEAVHKLATVAAGAPRAHFRML